MYAQHIAGIRNRRMGLGASPARAAAFPAPRPNGALSVQIPTMKNKEKPTVLLLGPVPPPYMGPSIATRIILGSRIKENFTLLHLNTNTHETIETLGALSAKSMRGNFLLYAKMIRLIIKHWPMLVLIPISQTTVGFMKDSIYVLISRMFLRKTLLQLRGSNFRNWLNASARLINSYVSFVLSLSQGVIVLGEKLRGLFEGYFPTERIFVVPNGADYSIQPTFEQHMRRNADCIKVLYLGNIQGSKGIEDAIRAIECLKDDSDAGKFKLQVVGAWFTDGIREGLLKRVKDRGLPVKFHGSAVGKTKWSFLTAADIFLFTPREPEGHPWAIVEAMAAGLPIISTDQGAITESVIDGVNGFIVESRSPQQIVAKLKILIEDPELRMRMGRESRRLYLENFTEAKMVERLTTTFRSVLGNN